MTQVNLFGHKNKRTHIMKTFYFFLMTLLAAATLEAQTDISKSFQASGLNTLSGNFKWGDVTVSNWNENRIEISGTVSINNGENDDAFKLETKQSGGILSIRTYVKDMDKLPKMVTVVHEGKKYSFKEAENYNKQLQQLKQELGVDELKVYKSGADLEIKLQIKVPANLQLDLKSTYGDIDLDKCANQMDILNTYGHIHAVFDNRGQMPDANLESTYSFVDVGVPGNADFDVVLHTNYGSLLTDLDIDIDPSASKEKAFYNKVVGKVNQGGPSLNIKATYNKIYLRKI
jgi:hypothetical protein